MRRLIHYLTLPHIDASTFMVSRYVFFRLLGLVYLIAFASYATQVEGLIGSRGIVPANEFIKIAGAQFGPEKIFYVPTIFWFFREGFAFFAILGSAFALILILIRKATVVTLTLLYILYLSFQVVSGPFLSFQWDILLLEIGAVAILFALSPTKLSLTLLWLILFKLLFLSGVVKLASGDTNWRNLTALAYHFETQPLPNPIAWYMHQMPLWIHQISTFATFFLELAVPFSIFAPRVLRHIGAVLLIGLQFFISTTGNYTFFNLLTITACILLFDDQFWTKIVPKRLQRFIAHRKAASKTPFLITLYTKVICVILITTNLLLLMAPFLRTPLIGYPASILLRLTSPLRVVNHYGLFARMTTKRDEIIIEGSDDNEVWRQYKFRFKPQDLDEAPTIVAPHQPRLDWQMWFAALSTADEQPWFQNLAFRLLQGEPTVTRLFAENPFPDKPPTYIRATRYTYHFMTISEKNKSGNWWKREEKGLYLPPTSFAGRIENTQ